MGFADLHAHVLPGLDDGPADLGESLDVLRTSWESGTTRITATPHLFHDGFPHVSAERIRAAFQKLTQDLKEHSGQEGLHFLSEMTVELGAEHYLSPELRIALQQRTVFGLNQSRYVLVEGPLTLSGLNWKESLSRITSAGYFPVIAHAERYWPFQRDTGLLREFIDLGAIVQINAGSIAPGGDRSYSKTARKLLRRGLVHLLASDTHHAQRRPSRLKEAVAALPGGPDGEIATLLTDTNPSRILDDRDPPDPVTARTSLWSLLRRHSN